MSAVCSAIQQLHMPSGSVESNLDPGAGGSLGYDQLAGPNKRVNDGSAVGAGIILGKDIGHGQAVCLCTGCRDGRAISADAASPLDGANGPDVCNSLRGGPCHHGDLHVDRCDIRPILGIATRKAANVHP